MKLLKIHITNFGGLSDFTRELSGGLNCIKEENGWGKSTLACFIRVMLFGFENERKRGIASERNRMKPWNGGEFGGYLEFEQKGRTYRLTKTFGANEAGDTGSLYDLGTGLLSSDYSDKPGEEIFGIDASGFVNTLFIGQESLKSEAGDTVRAKLGNLAGINDDMDRFQDADERLKKLMGRTANVGLGAFLDQCRENINSLEAGVRTLPAENQAVSRLQELLKTGREELARAKAKDAALLAERKAVTDALACKAKKDNYDSLLAERDGRCRALAGCSDAFGGKVPDGPELEANAKVAAELHRKEIALSQSRLSQEEEAFLGCYAPVYAVGVPGAEEINQVRAMVRSLDGKQKEYDVLQFSPEESADFAFIGERYSGKGNAGERAEALIGKCSALAGLKASIDADERKLQEMESEAVSCSKGIVPLVLFALAFVLALLGVLILVVESGLMGTALLGAAAVFIAVGIGLRKRNREARRLAEKKLEETESFRARLGEMKAAYEADRTDAVLFVSSLDLPAGEDALISSLFKIKSEYERYDILLKKQQDKRDDELASEMAEISRKIRDFLLPYSPVFNGAEDTAEKLELLRSNAEGYSRLRRQKTAYDTGIAAAAAEKEPLLLYAKDHGFYLPDLGIDALYTKMKEAFSRYESARFELDKADLALREFERNNDMDKVRSFDFSVPMRTAAEIDYESKQLHDEMEKLQGDILSYANDLEEHLQRIDELNADAGALALEREKKAQLEEKLRLVELTKRLLEVARSSFTDRFKQPVEDGFRRYYALLGGEDASRYIVSTEMELKVDEGGSLRSPELYSSGIQDRLNLCMRMGLVDAMYQGEKPFVVMDDPFTNLDDARLAGGLDMVRKLAEDRQIIYFTCHESRAVS